jgi:hypothetical protein
MNENSEYPTFLSDFRIIDKLNAFLQTVFNFGTIEETFTTLNEKLKSFVIWEIWVFVVTREKVRVEIYSIPGKLLLIWE